MGHAAYFFSTSLHIVSSFFRSFSISAKVLSGVEGFVCGFKRLTAFELSVSPALHQWPEFFLLAGASLGKLYGFKMWLEVGH